MTPKLYTQEELDAAVAREREAWRSKVNAAWEDYWGTSFFDDYERLEAALGALRGLTDEQIVPDVEQHRKYTADEVQKTAQSAVEMMMDREREAWIEAVIANTGKGGEWLCSPAELVAQMPTLIRARSGAHEPWVEHEHPFRCSLCGVELAKHARGSAGGG